MRFSRAGITRAARMRSRSESNARNEKPSRCREGRCFAWNGPRSEHSGVIAASAAD